MELIVIGLNHKTATIETRERLAFPEGEMDKALSRVKAIPSLKENMILSTCNRVEIYAAGREPHRAILDVKEFLSQYHGIPLAEFENSLYCHIGKEAVEHTFRVASSLDSMVKGEPQILGQMKEAYGFAAHTKTSGLLLNRLLHRAFHVAKRVRTETKVGNSAVSVSSVAVELAKKIFETLEKKVVLLIGAGEMCELAAQHLVSAGIEKILVTNRTYERAVALAREFRGEPVLFEEMDQGLKRADIVISSTGSSHYLFGCDRVAKVLRDRRQKPIFFIDIAVPRDIDPGINSIENAYLYNIDDLQSAVNQNIQDREKEAQKAGMIVEDEVCKFFVWYRSLEKTPTILALRKKFEEIRQKELGKTLSLHPHLGDKERQSLEALTCAIVNKILHSPLSTLKQSDETAMTDVYIDALRTLFQLPEFSSEDFQDGRCIESEKEKEKSQSDVF